MKNQKPISLEKISREYDSNLELKNDFDYKEPSFIKSFFKYFVPVSGDIKFIGEANKLGLSKTQKIIYVGSFTGLKCLFYTSLVLLAREMDKEGLFDYIKKLIFD